MPQFECVNHLWGRTTNPSNANFTCGGSSGGEAALLAMDGAGIGLGSDIGGSLRIPAAYCGIYSLKTSFGRISRGGIQSMCRFHYQKPYVALICLVMQALILDMKESRWSVGQWLGERDSLLRSLFRNTQFALIVP